MPKLPSYKSHKTVQALKIKSVKLVNTSIAELKQALSGQTSPNCIGAILTMEDDAYEPIEVDWAYTNKHEPEAGGYYVVYADGYKSFSPAEAFEDGYTLIEDEPVNTQEIPEQIFRAAMTGSGNDVDLRALAFLLSLGLARIKDHGGGKASSRQLALALTKIQEAVFWIEDHRAEEMRAQG